MSLEMSMNPGKLILKTVTSFNEKTMCFETGRKGDSFLLFVSAPVDHNE